jgi:hypothetical protein
MENFKRELKSIFFKVKGKPGMVVHACNPSYLEVRGRRIMSSRPDPDSKTK